MSVHGINTHYERDSHRVAASRIQYRDVTNRVKDNEAVANRVINDKVADRVESNDKEARRLDIAA